MEVRGILSLDKTVKYPWKINMTNKVTKSQSFPKAQSFNLRGFTLVEMIVSLGIFAVVAVVALGALVRIMTANQKAQTLQSAMTNISFALESMSRELRSGITYHCDYDTTTGLYENDATFNNLLTIKSIRIVTKV